MLGIFSHFVIKSRFNWPIGKKKRLKTMIVDFIAYLPLSATTARKKNRSNPQRVGYCGMDELCQ